MQDPNQNLDKNWCIVVLKFMGFYWRGMVLIIWPFISALVFLISFEEKIRCLFVLVLMAGYWVSEAIPLYVTGLMPVFLLPFLAVQSTGDVCVHYLNKTNFMFASSIFVAIGIEHVGLHKRIAYFTIMRFGCSPRRLHFALTMVTMILSMWLVNAATTAMMCPIIGAILSELETQGVGSMYYPKKPTDAEDDPPRPTNITVGYFLTASYSSSIGGVGTIIGTSTNLTYKGIYETFFPDGNTIEFVPWFAFNVVPMFLMGLFCFFSLEIIFMGLWRPNSEEAKIIKAGGEHEEAAMRVMKQKMEELGKFSFSEVMVLILFLILITMWVTRSPNFMTGWGDLYESIKVVDATPAVLVVFCFAVIPSSIAFYDYCTKDKTLRPAKATTCLVPWSAIQNKMPWGLLFLLGGGFALANAGKVSGMSAFLGEQLTGMKHLHPFLVLCITNLAANLATELTANVAICNIVSPILIEMSIAMGVHPMSFTLPAAVMCSFAFLLPVGTPPNAIVAGFVNIRTVDMIKGGILLKLFSWLIYVVLYPTYGRLFYDQGDIPGWAKHNTTTPKP